MTAPPMAYGELPSSQSKGRERGSLSGIRISCRRGEQKSQGSDGCQRNNAPADDAGANKVMKISPEQARKNQEAVALVANSVGQMVTKRPERKYVLNEAIDLVADKFKAARERKTVEPAKAEKTLAELLAESAQDEE